MGVVFFVARAVASFAQTGGGMVTGSMTGSTRAAEIVAG
jgi:hypothetical protein